MATLPPTGTCMHPLGNCAGMELLEYPLPLTVRLRCRIWASQLTAWLVIIVFSKAIVASVLIAGAIPLGTFGELLFRSLHNYPFAKLLLVMVVCPSFLNVVQFWIQDSFLKRDVSILPPAYARFRYSFEESLQAKLLQD